MLFALVGARPLQRFAIGEGLLVGAVGVVGAVLRGGALGLAPLPQRARGEQRRARVRDRVEPGTNLVDLRFRLDRKVFAIHVDESTGGGVGVHEPFEGAPDLLHVAEGAGRVQDQLIVERAQAVGEGLREPARIEILGQLRTAQRENQIDELVVALRAEAEHARIDRRPILHRPVHDRVGADLFGELFAGQRAVVGADEREVHSHPAVGHEIPARHLVRGAGGAHADADRDDLGIGPPPARELHPHIRIRRILLAIQQIRLHRAFLTRERVQPARLDTAVEHEREQHLESLRLARPVGPAQHQPAVGEAELLIAVVPQVDDPGPGRDETHSAVDDRHVRSLPSRCRRTTPRCAAYAR
ncbi:hypothetical protein IU484_03785 [Nocardia farcinica]|nr:hypothetical protein [Nocardia farcinica]MBF6139163.1 hypothetical protein [Nocardia farcinica]